MFQVHLRINYVPLLFDGLICRFWGDPINIQYSRGPMFLYWLPWCLFALVPLQFLLITWSVWVLQKTSWISLGMDKLWYPDPNHCVVFVNIYFISLTQLNFTQKVVVDYCLVIFWIITHVCCENENSLFPFNFIPLLYGPYSDLGVDTDWLVSVVTNNGGVDSQVVTSNYYTINLAIMPKQNSNLPLLTWPSCVLNLLDVGYLNVVKLWFNQCLSKITSLTSSASLEYTGEKCIYLR